MLNRNHNIKRMLSLLLAFLLVFPSGVAVFAADDVFDRYKHYESRINNGRGASDHSNGAALTWSESRYMDSYMDIYETYEDTYWLDKFIDHFDRVKEEATDLEGNGFYTWDSPDYTLRHLNNPGFEDDGQDEVAAELIANGGFEESVNEDSRTPTFWNREAGDDTVVYRTTTAGEYFSGDAGLVVQYNGGNEAILNQEIEYVPGKEYSVSFAAKTINRHTAGKIEIYDATQSKVVGESRSFAWESIFVDEWRRLSFNFKAPAASGNTLVIRMKLLDYDQPGWTVYYDDISIKPTATPQKQTVEVGGFWREDPNDRTLPDQWIRTGRDVDSSNVYRTEAAGEYVTAHSGVVIKSDGSYWKSLEQAIPYRPGETYRVSFHGKTNSNTAHGKVKIVDDNGTIASLDFNNTEWEKHSFLFEAPAQAGNTLKIQLRQNKYNDASWIVYYDDVSVTLTRDVNRGFRSWERVNSDSSTVYASDADEAVRSGSYGLVVGNDGSGTDGYVEQQVMAYEPDKKYGVYYRAKTSDASQSGKVVVFDETTSEILAEQEFSNTEWSPVEYLEFYTPAQKDHVIKVQLKQTDHTDSSAVAYFDDVQVGQYKGLLVDDAMISKPVLRFIKAVYDNNTLPAEYKSKADEYLDFIENDVFPQWDPYYRDLGDGMGAYVNKDGNDGRWFPGRSLPHNHNLVAAECYVYLWKLTNNIEYRERAASLYEGFKSKVITNTLADTAYQWNYWDSFGSWDDGFWYTSPVEDISHGTIDVSSLIVAYRYGVVFNMTDMKKLASTFVDAMWNGSTTNPMLGKRLNIKGTTSSNSNSQAIWDWVRLAQFDPQIWDIANTIVENHGGSNARLLRIMSKLVKMNPGIKVNDKPGSPANTILPSLWNSFAPNGGFELSDNGDPTLPRYWERSSGTLSSNAFITASDKYKENASLQLNTDPAAGEQLLVYRLHGYKPGATYKLTFYSKTNGSAAKAKAYVVNETNDTILASQVVDNTTWQQYEVTFTAPADYEDELKIYLGHDDSTVSNGTAYFDELGVFIQ